MATPLRGGPKAPSPQTPESKGQELKGPNARSQARPHSPNEVARVLGADAPEPIPEEHEPRVGRAATAQSPLRSFRCWGQRTAARAAHAEPRAAPGRCHLVAGTTSSRSVSCAKTEIAPRTLLPLLSMLQ